MNKEYYIGIRCSDKDALESYLDRVKIQHTVIVSDVFNSNGFIYKMCMDPESEMSLKLTVPITMCISISEVFENKETT